MQSLSVSVINSLLVVCIDCTVNVVQKASPQRISSSKVAGLRCVRTLHGRCNNDTLRLYHANNLVFRHKDHFKLYEDHCKKLNIPLHPRAIPANTPSALNRYYRVIIYDIATTLLISLPVKEVLTMWSLVSLAHLPSPRTDWLTTSSSLWSVKIR